MLLKSKRIIGILSVVIVGMSITSGGATGSTKENSSVKLDPTTAIEVDGGKITGTSSSDSKVAIYRGIQYAAPPDGDLRWKEPQPVDSWEGIKEATKFGASAIQETQGSFGPWSTEFVVDSSTGYYENCLSLNVWTKKESTTNKQPVVVYIHGGGNNSGGSSCEVYDGEGIAKKDVVYVSINYRVGILGFLALPELSAESKEGVSGNYAILDQIAALKWVKNNITKFNGDPDNVTLVGQSAGAMDVNALCVSPKAKGLFKNAVSMSGSSATMNYKTMAEQEAANAALLGGKTLKELRTMSTTELLKLKYSAGICVDGKVILNNFLDVYKSGTQNDVNMMLGSVQGDGMMGILGFTMEAPTTMTKVEYETAVRKALGKFADKCLALYGVNDTNIISQYNDINQDAMMASNLYYAKERALKGKQKTYVYLFDHVMPGVNSKQDGAFHTSDVPYFLNHFSSQRESYWTKDDFNLGDKMSSYLVNFAKTGEPNGIGLTSWEPYNGDMSYLQIGDKISTNKLSEEKTKFWQEYYGSLLGI